MADADRRRHRNRGRLASLLVIHLALVAGCQPSWPDGLALPEPTQGPLPDDAPDKFMFRGHVVQPVAAFDIKALVLAKSRYRFNRGAEVSEVDLALGWGPMARGDVLRQIRVRQNDRFYFTSWKGSGPIKREEVGRHSANMHLVFASDDVEDAVDDISPGEVIRLTGALVNVTGPDGWEMRSSTVRTDTGGGACEVIWVDYAEASEG